MREQTGVESPSVTKTGLTWTTYIYDGIGGIRSVRAPAEHDEVYVGCWIGDGDGSAASGLASAFHQLGRRWRECQHSQWESEFYAAVADGEGARRDVTGNWAELQFTELAAGQFGHVELLLKAT